MPPPPDPIQVTPQQIRRYIKGHGFKTLADAKGELECQIGDDFDITGCDAWEKRGIRISDLESPFAKEIVAAVHSHEDGTSILSPIEVRVWRKRMGLSQPEASEFLGVARTTLSRWEKSGIIEAGVGIAAHALAASVASKDPERLTERIRTIPILLDLNRKAGRKPQTAIEEAIAISLWGGQGEYARLGLGSYGLYRLLKDAWDTLACPSCFAMNPTDARNCSSCGSSLTSNKEVPKD